MILLYIILSIYIYYIFMYMCICTIRAYNMWNDLEILHYVRYIGVDNVTRFQTIILIYRPIINSK